MSAEPLALRSKGSARTNVQHESFDDENDDVPAELRIIDILPNAFQLCEDISGVTFLDVAKIFSMQLLRNYPH